MAPLSNPRRELFVQNLVRGMVPEAAYEAAGYKPHRQNAHRLMTNDDLRCRVEELLQEVAEEIPLDVVKQLERLAGSDIRKVVKWRSNATVIGKHPETGADVTRAFNEVELIDSDQVDDDTAAAISEVSMTKDGALRVKLASKDGALNLLARIRNLTKPEAQVHLHEHHHHESPLALIEERLEQISQRMGTKELPAPEKV